MKHKKLTITAISFLAVFIVIGIPIIINGLYKLNYEYITVWSRAELLGYYGAILASVGGVLGVFFTVRYSQKQYLDDARLRIMPFVATDYLIHKDCYRDFVKLDNDEKIVDNNGFDHFVITYCKEKGVQFPLYLDEDKAKLLDQKGSYQEVDTKTGARITSYKNIYFLPCSLKNVGSVVALKLIFGLYKLVDGEYTQKIDDRITSRPFVLDKGDEIFVGLYWDLDDEEAIGIYRFDLMYSDTSYTRYYRSIVFEFIQENDTISVKRTDTCEHEIYSTKEN